MEISDTLRRIAEIDDELERRGTNQLLSELEELKKDLKMKLEDVEGNTIYDEVTGYKATLQLRHRELYNYDKFLGIATEKQVERYTKKIVDADSVNNGIKNGDLSRPKLENAGVIIKMPIGTALYIKRTSNDEVS